MSLTLLMYKIKKRNKKMIPDFIDDNKINEAK